MTNYFSGILFPNSFLIALILVPGYKVIVGIMALGHDILEFA